VNGPIRLRWLEINHDRWLLPASTDVNAVRSQIADAVASGDTTQVTVILTDSYRGVGSSSYMFSKQWVELTVAGRNVTAFAVFEHVYDRHGDFEPD
jgi:hypothetical protein